MKMRAIKLPRGVHLVYERSARFLLRLVPRGVTSLITDSRDKRNMANRRRKKKIPLKGTVIVLAVIVVLGLIFLIAGGLKTYHSSRKAQAEIQENVQVLKEMNAREVINPNESSSGQGQTADPASGQGSAPGSGESSDPSPKPAENMDLSAEQEKIMSMNLDEYNNEQTRLWFDGTVILGDSITMAAAEYGYLDYDVIVAKIGVGLSNGDEQFEEAIAKQPKVLFVCLGNNDISNYLGDPALFTEQYKTALSKLRAGLPNIPFYLHGIMPEQEGVYEEGMEFREAYNSALEKLCSETENTYYVNSDFILQTDPDLYDADGIHPVSSFYPRWLTYLADVSGLSSDH